MTEYATYAFYTERNQRIAAFCRPFGEGKLEILLLMCSAKDHFHKRVAKDFYSAWKADEVLSVGAGGFQVSYHIFHPKVFYIDPAGDPKKAFLDFMERGYYRKKEIHFREYSDFEQFCLYQKGRNGMIPVSKPKRIYTKLDAR